MARIYWRTDFQRKDKTKGSVAFEVINLLHEQESTYKIFAYITGDEQKGLKEQGLI